MNGTEMLDLLGDVQEAYIMEAQKHREKKTPAHRRSTLKILLVAAAVTSLLAGCAYAVMRLQNLSMGEYTVTYYVPADSADGTVSEQSEGMTPRTEVRNSISLQGFMGSANYQAAREWNAFENSYDQDRELLYANNFFNAPRAYDGYKVYTQEMMDKVDEICQKYNLEKMGQIWLEQTNMPFMFDILGIEGVIAQDAEAKIHYSCGYYYECGTYEVEGELTLTGENNPWPHRVNYTVRCVLKEYLDLVLASVGKFEDYDQWNYITGDGTEVLMVLGRELNETWGNLGWLVVDKDDRFITVGIQSDADGEKMDRAAMEAVADAFDLNVSPGAVDADRANAREAEELAWWEKHDQFRQEHPDRPLEFDSYADLIAFDQLWFSRPDLQEYALMDITGDGEPELFIGEWQSGKKSDFSIAYTMSSGKATRILGSGLYLCRDNILCALWSEKMERECHNFYRIEDGTPVLIDSIVYFEETDTWGRSSDGDEDCERTITEQEAREAIASYGRVPVAMKPSSGFPLE